MKKNLVLALSFGLSVYLVLALVSGLDDLENALSGFHWSLLAMAFGLLAASHATRFARWSYYLKLLGVYVPLRMNVTNLRCGTLYDDLAG